MSIRFGLGPFSGQLPPGDPRSHADEYADTLALARLAEELGFDSFWVTEHHGAADGYLPSLLVALAAVAAVTERIALGTAVALAPLQHPLRFAEDCAVVDQLSRGRLIVGLGAGWRKEEFRAFGVRIEERVARTIELARTCRRAWDEGSVGDGTAVTPRPFGRLPLLLGGTVARAARRAGSVADGFIGTPPTKVGGSESLRLFRSLVAEFDAGARDAGRDPRALPLAFHMNAWVSPSGALDTGVRAAMWHQIGTYSAWHARDEGQAATDELPPVDDEAIARRTWMGAPREVIAQASPWIDAFAERDLHVIVRLHYPGMRRETAERALRLFATEVMPALRRRAAS
ncbi:MAG: LLM class flavin-dependent oxidoreductase [Chloroflexota bacterium]|nr:LLM class flavin-dependent oxidoreductase [Chloroflexota bacterium]